MKQLHLETILWLILVGGPCWSLALPLLSFVRKERGLLNGSSTASMNSKHLFFLYKYIWAQGYLGFGFLTCILLFLLWCFQVGLGNYWSEKLLLKLLDAEILQESHTLWTGAFSPRDHGRNRCHYKKSVWCPASCHRKQVILMLLGTEDYLSLKLKPNCNCTLSWYEALVCCLVIISL